MVNIFVLQSRCPGRSLGHSLPHRSLGGGTVTPARVGARWLGGRLAGPRIAARRKARSQSLAPAALGAPGFTTPPRAAPPAPLIRNRGGSQVPALLRSRCRGETKTGVERRRTPECKQLGIPIVEAAPGASGQCPGCLPAGRDNAPGPAPCVN